MADVICKLEIIGWIIVYRGRWYQFHLPMKLYFQIARNCATFHLKCITSYDFGHFPTPVLTVFLLIELIHFGFCPSSIYASFKYLYLWHHWRGTLYFSNPLTYAAEAVLSFCHQVYLDLFHIGGGNFNVKQRRHFSVLYS